MTERWLVTGGNGFLGMNAARALAGRVHLIAGTRSGALPRGFHESVRLDLSEPQSIQAAIAAARPAVVLNTAAIADHEACIADPHLARIVNAEAVGVLAATTAKVGTLLVHVSTDAVFDGSRGHYAETDEPNPFSVYGETKLLGEKVALEETSCLVVRTNFFGWSPSGTRSILEFFVGSLSAGTPVRGYDDFIVTSIYAIDLIETIEALLAQEARGVAHVASRDALSKYAFGRAVADTFGLDSSLITPASAASGAHDASRVRDLSLDCTRVQAIIGRELPSQDEGIQRAYRDRLR